MTAHRSPAATPESAIAVLLVDGALIAGVGSPSLGLPASASSPAGGFLLLLSLASALWALAGLFVPTAASVRPAARLLGAAIIVLAASVVADQLARLSLGVTVFAILAIAGAAALPIAGPKVAAWALDDIAEGGGAPSPATPPRIVQRERMKRGSTTPRRGGAGSDEPRRRRHAPGPQGPA